jgi:hypothetical protein
MGQAKRRASEIAVLKAEQPEILWDALRLGAPNKCFYNSMKAVWKLPQRLKYVEGFEIAESEHEGVRYARFNHHARVLDTVTGVIHEVTPRHEDCKYVYKEYWRHELTAFEGLFEDLIESPEEWEPQLSLQEQYDMLKAAGYDIELRQVHNIYDKVTYDTIEYDERSCPLTDENRSRKSSFDCTVEQLEGETWEQFYQRATYWEHEWRLKEAEEAQQGVAELQT